MSLIIVTFAKNASEWRQEVLERAGYRCESQTHAKGCNADLKAHHICFKSHIVPRNYWVVENGAAVSEACHLLAHATHNVSLGLDRANRAVDILNLLEDIKLPRFTKKRVA